MTKVSVVIPTLASEVTKPYLKLCVESLRATTDWSIMVVTNGTKHKPDLKDIKGISTHLHIPAQGQCIATNYGAQLVSSSDTDYIMVSNDDMVYAPYWNKKLRYDYPIFSPNLIEPTDNAGSATPFLKRDWGYTIEEFKKERADKGVINAIEMIRPNYNSLDEPNHLEETGFNLPFFIKKDLWNFLKGYDTAYDPWSSNSDTDLQTRINLAGVTPMRLRDVLVYHFSNKSGTFDGTHQDFYQNNIDYFKSKFGFDRDELGSDVWYNKDMLPTDESKIKYKQAKYDS